MKNGEVPSTRECPVCHAPVVVMAGDELTRCDKCGTEFVCRISFEQRVSMVVLESIIRKEQRSLPLVFVVVMAACHLEYVSLRWALTTASGWKVLFAWGGAVYCGVVFVLMIASKVGEERRIGRLRRIAEKSQYVFDRFRDLAMCPDSGISSRRMHSYEREYESVKKWMS